MSYYLCHKCEGPSFGGLEGCEAEAGAAKQGKPEDLVCPPCASSGKFDKCPLHGADFATYKCRYCCQPALWFCFGTTHFCNPCHTSMRRRAAPCAGGAECPWRGRHPPNGEEHCVGCSRCLLDQ